MYLSDNLKIDEFFSPTVTSHSLKTFLCKDKSCTYDAMWAYELKTNTYSYLNGKMPTTDSGIWTSDVRDVGGQQFVKLFLFN